MTPVAEQMRAQALDWLADLRPYQRAHLLRLSAEYDEKADHILWQVVVLADADDDEIEEYSCIATEVLADFQTATIREALIRLDKIEDLKHVGALAVPIFEAKA